MKRAKYIALLLCASSLVLFAACSVQTSSQELDSIYDRLEMVDEFFNENVPEIPEENPIAARTPGTFRDVPFGSSRSTVLESETLSLTYEYDNAIDYAGISIFGYDMVPTFWFNSSGEFCRGSYFMTTSSPLSKIKGSVLVQLGDLYGTAAETNYYDYNNELAYSTDDQSLEDMVISGEAYFYAYFIDGDIAVEFVIEAGEYNPEYEVYIMYTDYLYY